jgi:hypothetical protein
MRTGGLMGLALLTSLALSACAPIPPPPPPEPPPPAVVIPPICPTDGSPCFDTPWPNP